MIPCAFSPSIPDNLITNSNPFETDLKSIAKWIQKYEANVQLIKALILLIDINFRKYESKEVARLLLPSLEKLLHCSEYKRLVSALLINNFDLFFDEIGLIEFGHLFSIFYHPPKENGDIFNEWALNKISHSSLLSKIIMNEEFAMSLFTHKWQSISRNQDPYSWFVDVLLIAQQNSFEEAVEIVEKDPLNLNKSTLISTLCSYAQFLMCHFVKVLEKVIEENPNIQNRKLDYDS